MTPDYPEWRCHSETTDYHRYDTIYNERRYTVLRHIVSNWILDADSRSHSVFRVSLRIVTETYPLVSVYQEDFSLPFDADDRIAHIRRHLDEYLLMARL